MKKLSIDLHLGKFLFFLFAGALLLLGVTCDSNNSGSQPAVSLIGDLDSKLADGIDEQVNLIPYDGGSDKPIILQADSVFTLSDNEKAGIKETYNSGFTIVLLDAEKPAIDALLDIIDDGHSLSSESDPLLLAYIVRNEGHHATRLLAEAMPPPGLIMIVR